MWGSQGWNQWALQPAMFNDVPHEQIDWAELAKQWIQMQQTHPSDGVPMAPPHLPPHPSQVGPPVSLPPPPGHVPLMSEEFPENNIVPPLLKTPVPPPVMPEPFRAESAFDSEPVPFVPKTTDNSSFWNKPQWEASVPNDVEDRLWVPPPVEPAAPLLPGKETFDYGHVHDNPPLAMQSIDYNHMSDFSFNQMYPTPAPAPEAPYDQYWSQVNATPTISPIFLKKERSTTNLPVEEESTQLDAAKRKQLPAWIRDGLEKMEQERLKRLEKERAAKESAEKKAKMDSLKNNMEFKDGSSSIPASTKSKFDSDSEVEEIEPSENKLSSPVPKRTPSPIEDMRTEEERKEDLMLKVRRTLTEVLLSVTNSEMVDIAQEMYRKAVSKAPARQLATASSLSSVASGLRGLASYGTESEASEPDEDDASDSEEELYRKIKEKKRLFAQKEKKIIAELERKEYEEKFEAEREKINNDKSSEKKTSKDFHTPEKLEESSSNNNMVNEIDNSIIHTKPAELNLQVEPSVLFVKAEENNKSNQITAETVKPAAENAKSGKKEESYSSDSDESSSSDSTSESGGKRKKKSHKEVKKSKSESKKSSKKDKSSSKHSSRRRRSRSRDSESSEKHRRERSRDRKNSSSKKKKKYKRSDSSGSSSSSSHRRKHSSRYESSHSRRERRSRSYDDRERRRKRSVSPKVRGKSDSRSSRSHRYSDDKKYKEEKKYYDHRHSPSPSGHSSRLPRKYRSRSLSSEGQSPGKKLKKYRNR